MKNLVKALASGNSNGFLV